MGGAEWWLGGTPPLRATMAMASRAASRVGHVSHAARAAARLARGMIWLWLVRFTGIAVRSTGTTDWFVDLQLCRTVARIRYRRYSLYRIASGGMIYLHH